MSDNLPDNDVDESDPQNKAGAAPNSSDAEQAEQGASRKPPKPKPKPDDPVGLCEKLKLFSATHSAGIVAVWTPLLFSAVLQTNEGPPEKWQWVAFTLFVMAVYWVFECIPLPVTSFLPIVIFPLVGVMDTRTVAVYFINDTVIMFLGSIMLAASVEQSGLHKRVALYSIKIIGYSHLKMLFAVAFVTMFISMWITNTAAATMMVPIVFALLKVYENEGLYKIYETDPITGEIHSTHVTSCYFCCITYAATIGGIGTLVGTATNLVFKGLFVNTYPAAPEFISFPLFSAFAVPYMLVLNLAMYLFLAIVYMGLFRPSSAAAKSIQIPAKGLIAAKKAVEEQIKALGGITCHEIMVCILFGGAMILFFARSPELFTGWSDAILDYLEIPRLTKYIKDSAVAIGIIFLMTFLPANGSFFKNFSAKFTDELPKKSVPSVLNWDLMNASLPYSFSFLLAGGFVLSNAAKKDYSNLNGQIGKILEKLVGMPNAAVLLVVIIFTVFLTNFASNVAICNVVTPIAMQLAMKLKVNPLWYCIASGLAASYCFMLPVGTPGNLVVQTAAKIPTGHMIYAGSGPTISTILLTWVFMYLYAPVIWPVLHEMPWWTLFMF